MAGAVQNLTPWKKGQSGNPNGHSKGRRRAKRLREALDTMLAEEVPPEILAQVDPGMLETLPENMTFAELVALRVALLASTAKKPEHILAASNMILGFQQKPDQVPPHERPKPPTLPATEEQRQAVMLELGISDETPDGPIQ